MTALREAAQQALAFTMRDFAAMRDFEAARAVLHDALRAALKQEEEASAWLAERKEYWRKEKEKMQATNALRAALAQQDERDWSLLEATQESLREHMAEIHRLRAALAQQAEPVEPVAWMVYTLDGKSVCVTDNPADFSEKHRALPLYTAPRQRTPLTEEEISNIWDRHVVPVFGKNGINPIVFARAVEQAHEIKE